MKQTQKKPIGKKAVVSLLAWIVMLSVILVPDICAKADNLIIGLSAKTVQTGDKLTVTVSVPAGVVATVNLNYPSELLEYTSASGETSVNAGTVAMSVGEYGSKKRKSATVTFSAKAAGDAGISVSAPRAGNSDGDQVNIGAASTIVQIKGKAEEPQKSSDSSLSSLSVSGGQLSPAFSPEVFQYSMEVAKDVESIDVSASPKDSGAKVFAVEGNRNLSPGQNNVTVKVQAANGQTSTYTITVTRAAEEEQATDPTAGETDGQTSYESENGRRYLASETPAEVIPDGFTVSSEGYLVNEKLGGDLRLMYLVDENQKNGALYFVPDSEAEQVRPCICLKSEFGYIIVLPAEEEASLPKEYEKKQLTIPKKGTTEAYVRPEEPDIGMIYAVNNSGEKSWYQYDMKERTYLRYYGLTVENEGNEQTADVIDSDYVMDLESENRMIFWAFVLVTAVLLVIIVFLMLRGRRHPAEKEPEPEELDDFEEEVPYKKKKQSLTMPENDEEEELPEPEIEIPEWDKREEIPGQRTIDIKLPEDWDREKEIPGQRTVDIKLPEDWDREKEIPGQRTMDIQFPEMEEEEKIPSIVFPETEEEKKEQIPEIILPKEEEPEEEPQEEPEEEPQEETFSREEEPQWEEESRWEEESPRKKSRFEKKKKKRKNTEDEEEEDGLEFIDL